MRVYNLETGMKIESDKDLDLINTTVFILCNPQEIVNLQNVFDLDDSTIIDCMHYDENIRFTSYRHYDFISLIHFMLVDLKMEFGEINLFIGKNFLILVLQQGEGTDYVEHFNHLIEGKVKALSGQPDGIVRMYYYVFDKMLWDFSETLELLENEIKRVEDKIVAEATEAYFNESLQIKEIVYSVKKILRALLYIGDQFIVNENNMIPKDQMRFFRNLDVRINKMYDFANSLHDYANQLLQLYESKLASKTNAVVTKLTIVTVFFGPPTVIAGIYGMNFIYMPEINWILGYPFAILLMLAVSTFIFVVLKYKKWL